MIEELKCRLLSGGSITREEALKLIDEPLEELCKAAGELRASLCGSGFDLCSIVNAKSGRCSEDCAFCSQSSRYTTGSACYPLMDPDEMVACGAHDASEGVLRFSMVMSGRRATDAEVDQVCCATRRLRDETDLSVCVSLGLLDRQAFEHLAEAGLTRVHNNLETSRRYFPFVCRTHRYDDKLASIRAAREAGLDVCSGGIFGMGETWEDRIDMALELRELGVTSVPLNFLNPIAGTPFGEREPLSSDETRRIVAIYRFLLPQATLRLAGGRGLLDDKGRSCFAGGANGAITGDMLTTDGISVARDRAMVGELGFSVALLP